MIDFGTEPSVDPCILPQARLVRVVQATIEQFIIFFALCYKGLETMGIVRNRYGEMY